MLYLATEKHFLLVAHAQKVSEAMLLLLLHGGMTTTTVQLANTSMQLYAELRFLVYAQEQLSFASSEWRNSLYTRKMMV